MFEDISTNLQGDLHARIQEVQQPGCTLPPHTVLHWLGVRFMHGLCPVYLCMHARFAAVLGCMYNCVHRRDLIYFQRSKD